MAAKKKAKRKAKKRVKKKTAAKKRAVKKKVGKKTAKKKTARRKVAAKRPVKAKPASRPVKGVKPGAAPSGVPAPGEERVGVVTHYYNHLGVAIIQLESGVLREGDTVHIKGHTSDFRQRVGSMEVEHVHVNEARPGQSFGLKVSEHAREHDVVYRVKGM